MQGVLVLGGLLEMLQVSAWSNPVCVHATQSQSCVPTEWAEVKLGGGKSTPCMLTTTATGGACGGCENPPPWPFWAHGAHRGAEDSSVPLL